MKKIENLFRGIASWLCDPLVLLGFFVILMVFYGLCLYYKSDWEVPILFFSFLLLSLIAWYYGTIFVCKNVSQCSNKIKSQCSVIFDLEIIALIIFLSRNLFKTLINLLLGDIKLEIVVVLTMVFALFLLSYKKIECWWKWMLANIEEYFSNLGNSFDKFLLWLAFFLILLGLIFAGVVILYYNYSNRPWYEFLINLIINKDLFEWTFNLFLFTFFALIISVLGQLFFRNSNETESTEDSEFLFYMLSVRALIIWSIVLIVAYALTRTFILNAIHYSSSTCICKSELALCYIDKCASCVNFIKTVKNNMLIISIFLVSIYYSIFILVSSYFLKKFLEVISFAMPAHRLQMKIKVLSRSPLNKNTLRLWNALWRNEEFDNLWEEGIFLNSFIRKIVYYKIKITSIPFFKNYKDIFQLESKVTVAADALRGFSDNIDNRYSEALAIEILDIVPGRDAQPGLLLDYLTDVLNAYKDIVCNDKLVCEEPDFEISFYKWFFKSAANEFLPKYQYLDKLIYQILVTLRKSVGKLRNDGYFDYYDDRGKTLCEKFNEFVEEISHLECGNNESEERLEKALKTESAKKWIKEAGNLLEEVGNKINYYNIYYNIVCHDCSTLRSDFTKALQALKKGKIDADTLKEISKEWKKICKQDSAKQS